VTDVEALFQPGERITHPEYGQGVVLDPARDGYLRAFFGVGERRVPVASLRRELTRTERILRAVDGSAERGHKAWLSYEAHALPVMESASALTSAKIDLLPHQVVLTHRIATASPRRYLIADEVGLGKTIETALILRELASRGELIRALMVVPAGLVNNWHRELNEVFNLGFEVFGSEGDITDRKTNAFAKHDRLIASIDTLKRPARIKRLLDAPRWDLVVFDEAHHLTAYRSGGKVRKTENYKLAEALKDHARDLVLLSATPHQGNHFQFWMLVQLLNPTLFCSPDEMVENRHRLNTVMFRRTKADACQPDGSPLFARRWVHTESFVMAQEERLFYEKLREYLEDGFDLARRQGNQGRALGFLMAIFQKIAASSFAAVRRTLKRRLLMLTLHEALLRDKELDIEGRERLPAKTLCGNSPIELIGDRLQGALPAPPRRRAITGEADGDVAPAVLLGAHPHQMALFDFQPLHPAHRLQHPVDGFRAWRERAIDLLVGGEGFPLVAHDGRPGVEVALHTHGWQAASGVDRFLVTRGHVLNGPDSATVSHDAPLHKAVRRDAERTRAR